MPTATTLDAASDASLLPQGVSCKQNMSESSVLFISADSAAAGKIQTLFQDAFPEVFELCRVEALFDGLRALQDRTYGLILSDLYLPDGQGLATLRHLQQHAPNIPVIALCHSRDRDVAVTAVRKGAYDFFCYEDLDVGSLRRSVEGAMKHATAEAEKKAEAERRNNARFPCRLAVSYQTLEQPIFAGEGSSETLNISSKGLLFTSKEKLHPGQLVQVSLDWPVRLENQVPLKLVAEGRVVRNSQGQTAMTIDKYEFRTRRAAKPAAPAGQKTNGDRDRRP
jgi:FixJ family two-component response regulator